MWHLVEAGCHKLSNKRWLLRKEVRANCFCASLLRTQIHVPCHAWEHVVVNKMKWTNDWADGHCSKIACIYKDLGCSVIPVFLLMDHFVYQFSMFRERMKKICWLEVDFFLQNAPVNSVLFSSLVICGTDFKCLLNG